MSDADEALIELKKPSSPYVGLAPFSESDAAFFCGRELDSEIVAANLRANRMTLLYGASGVGKSSLINAGIVSRLRHICRETVKLNGKPDFIIAVFREWLGDPLDSIMNSLQAAVTEAGGELASVRIPPTRDLSQLLATTVSLTGAELLIILDQFEEYLLHPEHNMQEGSFAYEFPRAAERLDLPVKFLFSMREDSIAQLDFFKGRISAALDPFENRLAIKHLDKDTARRAIVEPVQRFNTLFGANYEVESALVERVLEELESNKIPVSVEGQARVGQNSEENRVETPYLQLVMRRVWDEEMKSKSHLLRLTTLTDKLGGAIRVVETYLDEVMNQLSAAEKELAAKFVHFTVTRYGTKIPVDAATLADWAGLPSDKERDIEKVLDSLGGNKRIFREVKPPSRQTFTTRSQTGPTPVFEIYHDALTPAVLSWRRKYTQERKLERLEATGRLLTALGRDSVGRAEFAKVKAAFEQALAIDKEIHGPDDPTVAEDANNLGSLLKDQGDLQGAKAYFERALKINLKAYGPEDAKAAVSLNSLGIILKDLGDLEGAQMEFERALEINLEKYGPEHPEVAVNLNNLGYLLKDKGDMERAHLYFERALKINKAAYGANHPSVATNLNNLGIILKDKGDTERAQKYFERALKISVASYGPNHPEVATNLDNLGYLMKDKGDAERARVYFERALSINEAAYGRDHPNVVSARKNLGSLKKQKVISKARRHTSNAP
jgi:tetratricopeptide (TPR) repeat protein